MFAVCGEALMDVYENGASATGMRVLSPQEAVLLEPDTVYVIPPSKMLSMNDGYLRVTELDRPRGRHVAIDLFFRTLATVHRERAFAVLLSGTGSDGAVGITRIKEEGGVSIVQNPNEAEFDGMVGLNAGQVTLASFVRCIYPDDQPLFDESLSRAFRGEPMHCQVRIRRADGLIGSVLLAARTARDSAGRPSRVFGVIRRIDERSSDEYPPDARQSPAVAFDAHSVGMGNGLHRWGIRRPRACDTQGIAPDDGMSLRVAGRGVRWRPRRGPPGGGGRRGGGIRG